MLNSTSFKISSFKNIEAKNFSSSALNILTPWQWIILTKDCVVSKKIFLQTGSVDRKCWPFVFKEARISPIFGRFSGAIVFWEDNAAKQFEDIWLSNFEKVLLSGFVFSSYDKKSTSCITLSNGIGSGVIPWSKSKNTFITYLGISQVGDIYNRENSENFQHFELWIPNWFWKHYIYNNWLCCRNILS